MSASFNARYSFLNVKAYGAAGDGVADDTAEIQAAIAAAAAGDSRGVWFPAGDYKVSEVGSDNYCLWLPGYVHLAGVGAYSRIMNTDTAADTIRVRNAPTVLTGFANYWSIRDLHFNPAVGVARSDTAAEIAVGLTREGTIERCGFGQRVAMHLGESTPSDDASRVGTCIKTGDSGTSTPSAVIKIHNCRGYGYFRFLHAVKCVDVFVSNTFADAFRGNAQTILLDDGTEAIVVFGCDFVNTVGLASEAGSSDACLKIVAGSRFNAFQGTFFDTHKYGVQVTGGESHDFTNCWFAPGKATSGAAVGALVSGGSGIRFVGCRFVGASRGLEWTGGINNLAAGCLIGHQTGNEGVLIGTGTRDWLLRDLWIDNDPFNGRVAAGSMTVGITVSGGGLPGRYRDCRFRTGGTTTWLTDVVV